MLHPHAALVALLHVVEDVVPELGRHRGEELLVHAVGLLGLAGIESECFGADETVGGREGNEASDRWHMYKCTEAQ